MIMNWKTTTKLVRLKFTIYFNDYIDYDTLPIPNTSKAPILDDLNNRSNIWTYMRHATLTFHPPNFRMRRKNVLRTNVIHVLRRNPHAIRINPNIIFLHPHTILFLEPAQIRLPPASIE